MFLIRMTVGGVGVEAQSIKKTRLIQLFVCKGFGSNQREVDVDLMKQNVCFWIRLSVEGVGGEAYSHEGMRKKTHVLLYVQGFGGIGQDG